MNVQIKYVSQEMQNFLSPAFYLIPALDNTEENIIYINNGHISDDLSLYTTLAHEGYPGHLYQTTYFASKTPSLSVISLTVADIPKDGLPIAKC